MGRRLLPLALLFFPPPAAAQAPVRFPAGATYIIEMTGPAVASGYAAYLVPPLRRAFDAAGLVYHGGPGAAYAATVRPQSDVGRWVGAGSSRRWLYTSTVEVGLTPAGERASPPEGSPAFAVTVTLMTPDADREDEFACLVDLAVREMVARYRPRGRIAAGGAICLRR